MRLLSKFSHKINGGVITYQCWTDNLSEAIGYIISHVGTLGDSFCVMVIKQSMFRRYIFFGPRKYTIIMEKSTMEVITEMLFGDDK